MPKRRKESGEKRQKRIQREQHRPEQNKGSDEAVRGGPALANEMQRTLDLIPSPPDERPANDAHDIDERESQRAVDEVRRQEHSAERRRLGEV